MELVREPREAEPRCPPHTATPGRTPKRRGAGTAPPALRRHRASSSKVGCARKPNGRSPEAAVQMISPCQWNLGENTSECEELSSALIKRVKSPAQRGWYLCLQHKDSTEGHGNA